MPGSAGVQRQGCERMLAADDSHGTWWIEFSGHIGFCLLVRTSVALEGMDARAVLPGCLGMEPVWKENTMAVVGALASQVQLVEDAREETMLLWGLAQPMLAAANTFVCQTALLLKLDACGQSVCIEQAAASMVWIPGCAAQRVVFRLPPNNTYLCWPPWQNKSGVTDAVMWDSGVVLAKFLEHAVDSGILQLQGKKLCGDNCRLQTSRLCCSTSWWTCGLDGRA